VELVVVIDLDFFTLEIATSFFLISLVIFLGLLLLFSGSSCYIIGTQSFEVIN